MIHRKKQNGAKDYSTKNKTGAGNRGAHRRDVSPVGISPGECCSFYSCQDIRKAAGGLVALFSLLGTSFPQFSSMPSSQQPLHRHLFNRDSWLLARRCEEASLSTHDWPLHVTLHSWLSAHVTDLQPPCSLSSFMDFYSCVYHMCL